MRLQLGANRNSRVTAGLTNVVIRISGDQGVDIRSSEDQAIQNRESRKFLKFDL